MKVQRREKDNAQLSPAVERVQKAHRRLLVVRWAGLDHGGDHDLEEPAARRIDKDADENSSHGIHVIREEREKKKPRRCHDMGKHQAEAVAETPDDRCAAKVDDKLDAEIESHKERDFGKRNGKLPRQLDKQKGQEVVDDCLDDIACKAGPDEGSLL